MTQKVVNELDREVWKSFVDAHPEGNVFHTPEMFEVYSQTKGYKPELWAVVEGGEILALHLPVFITLRGGLMHYLTTRNVSFGSVLVVPDDRGCDALSLLLQTYNRRARGATLFTELRNCCDLSCLQEVFDSHGYKYQNYLNYFVNLDRDEYDILQSFSRTARQAIRSTIRKGLVEVKEISEPEMLRIFYELVKMTYSNAGIPLADFSMFESAFKVLVPKKMARFTICYAKGIPVGASSTLNYKEVIYGWYNGMDREYGTYNQNEMMIWDFIHWGVQNGYKLLDFGGGGRPDEESGVRDFKLKFRGDLIEYGRNTCIHSPLRMKLAENTYNFSRKLVLSMREVLKKFDRLSLNQ